MKNELFLFELKRKMLHVLLTFYPFIFIYGNWSKQAALLFSVIYFSAWMASEYLRVKKNVETPTAVLLRFASRQLLTGNLKKSWNRIRFPYWIVGLSIVLALFNYTILWVATVILIFGDSACSLVTTFLNKRSRLLGFLSGFIVSAIIIQVLTQNYLLAIIPSLSGMASMLFNDKINDNLTLPLFAALGAVLVFLV